MYMVYLKDRTMNPLNNCLDQVHFPSDDPEAAQLIAEARFAEELKDPNKFIEIDVYAPTTLKVFRIDEDIDGEDE